MTRFIVLIVSVLLAASCATGPSTPKAAAKAAAKNLALGKTSTSNNHILDFVGENAFDGDTASYWEGAANTYPNTLTVDLEKKVSIKAIAVKLNPRKIWAGRTQTFEVLTSDDGVVFTTAKASADYEFSPLEGSNTVTVALNVSARYVRLSFTGNTEATGGQVAEFEVVGE